MRFLVTVFWAFLTTVIALFGWVNWAPVTVNLWSGIQADIKLPILLLIAFLIGFLPTWLWQRARIWSLRRRLEALERSRTSSKSPSHEPVDETEVVG